MTLREYLFRNDLTIQQFAEMVFFNRDYVSRVMRGICKPSKRFGLQVEMVTRGQIRYEDLFDKMPDRLVKKPCDVK